MRVQSQPSVEGPPSRYMSVASTMPWKALTRSLPRPLIPPPPTPTPTPTPTPQSQGPRVRMPAFKTIVRVERAVACRTAHECSYEKGAPPVVDEFFRVMASTYNLNTGPGESWPADLTLARSW